MPGPRAAQQARSICTWKPHAPGTQHRPAKRSCRRRHVGPLSAAAVPVGPCGRTRTQTARDKAVGGSRRSWLGNCPSEVQGCPCPALLVHREITAEPGRDSHCSNNTCFCCCLCLLFLVTSFVAAGESLYYSPRFFTLTPWIPPLQLSLWQAPRDLIKVARPSRPSVATVVATGRRNSP